MHMDVGLGHPLDEGDAEVSAAFRISAPTVALMQPTSAVKPGPSGGNPGPQYTIIDMDRSDDEESDHTPDPYTQHMRGRVSPSPYTANTERARQFNAYVRGVIEQKLDVLVPISHQPRDLISDIIADASVKFPEFSSCVRKRIRTYLKSYRRSKKMKDGQGFGPAQNGMGTVPRAEEGAVSAVAALTGITAVLPTSIAHALPQQNSTDAQQPAGGAGTAVVTIIADSPRMSEDQPPESKRLKLGPALQPTLQSALQPAIHPPRPLASTPPGQTLSNSEVSAVRQLITGYRESAAFLQRAADQLEAMLAKDSSTQAV